MKNQTLIIGGAIAVGVAAYFYYTKSKPKTDDGADTSTASTQKTAETTAPNSPSQGKASSMAQKALVLSQMPKKLSGASDNKAQRDDAKMEEGIKEWKYQPLAGMVVQTPEEMRTKKHAYNDFLQNWAKKNNVDYMAWKERRRRAAIDKIEQDKQNETAAFAFNGHSF